MIDNKKIEDAAKSLRKDFNDDVTQGFLVEFGFEKGAKWAINEFLKDLWHPASEKPERNTPYLAQLSVSPLETLRSFETFSDSRHWEQFSENSIIRWCYIDDLLPKQKGDNHD